MRQMQEMSSAVLEAINAPQTNGGGEPTAAEYVDIDGVRYWREKPHAEVVDPYKAGVEREGYVRITINIADFAEFIMVDNHKYHANMVYEIREDQLQSFQEIMARSWWHERATQGANTNRMYSARNSQMNLMTQASYNRGGPPGVPGN